MINKEKLIIVIGRGHGGTRLISETLSRSGIYMGTTNGSGDLVPAQAMYAAVRLAGAFVSMTSKHTWDFAKLLSSEPPEEFLKLVNFYLKDLKSNKNKNVGFKLPETLFALSWIFKMFPDACYIYLTRDIRDNISGRHITDNLSDFNVPHQTTPYHVVNNNLTSTIESRIESYLYQRQIVDATYKPQRFLEVKFEDFVLEQEKTLATISEFVEMPLVSVDVDKSKVGCYKNLGITVDKSILEKYGYGD